MMIRFIINGLVGLSVMVSAIGQVDFKKIHLDEITAEKPILVDVYTTWCGPCKLLDKTTFQDSDFSTIVNDNFTALKWDAEAGKFAHLAKQFEVQSYPTLLFLNSNHELVRRHIGYTEAPALSMITEEVLEYLNEEPLNPDDIPSLSYEESRQMLTRLTQFEDPNKNNLLVHFIEQLEADSSLWEDNINLVGINVSHDLELKYIEQFIHADEHTRKSGASTRKNIKKILLSKLEGAKRSADYTLYTQAARLIVASSNSTMSPNQVAAQHNFYRFDYYGFNKVKEHYKPLADSIVSEFILPHSPEKIMKSDRRSTQLMKEYMSQNPNQKEVKVDTTSIQYFQRQHPNGHRIANQLEDIAKTIMVIYDDEDSLRDALHYAMMAYDYMELPQYLVTKAKVQFKLGEITAAVKTLEEAKNHQFYSSQRRAVDRLLKRFGNN